MRVLHLIALIFITNLVFAQNKTGISLFLKSDSTHNLYEVHSSSGDLYDKLGHHGPAIENEWMGLRIYFDHKAAIDVYSKTKPGLELEGARWYPTPQQQKEGWGADYYKVGNTVGLGGVRLWDGDSVVLLNPVSNRSARVAKEGNVSLMEMLSEGVPYKNSKVDILVRVTVFSGIRQARVEAFALTDNAVQFVTGINYHDGQKVIKMKNYIITWGTHPEDVAAEKVEIGAAIIFNSKDFVSQMDDGKQFLLISAPVKQLEYWITSANALEPDMNTPEKFEEYVLSAIKK